MSGARDAKVPYPFTPDFQRVFACACASRQKLYGSVVRELDVDRFTDAPSRIVLKLAREHFKETGAGPSSPVVVCQRARLMVDNGKMKHDAFIAVQDLFLDAPDRLPADEELLSQVRPVLQAELRQAVVSSVMEDFSRKDVGFRRSREVMGRADKVGRIDTSLGAKFGQGTKQRLQEARSADRMPTDILELDAGLGGGLRRGKVGLVIAASKGGKSMFLKHFESAGLRRGKFVAEVTLEIPEEDQEARMLANLTGYSIDVITDGTMEEDVDEAFAEIVPYIGTYRTKFMPAKATRMSDIEAWVDEIELEEGRPIDLLIIDYIDKLGSDDPNHKSEYDIQGAAAERFRLYVKERGIFGWTAAQPKRREVKDRARRIDMEDVADSMGKIRAVDLIITVCRPTEGEVEVYVAGNRNGKDQYVAGKYEHQFWCARVCAPFIVSDDGGL